MYIILIVDYVFDGKNPPYKITDAPNPINKYGITKLKGEEVTLGASKSKFINLIKTFNRMMINLKLNDLF